MQQEKPTTFNTYGTIDRMVPKFCTSINIALLNNKNLVFTMAYNEGKEPAENGAIIERIVIDLEHAQSLNNVLTKLLQDIDHDSSYSQ